RRNYQRRAHRRLATRKSHHRWTRSAGKRRARQPEQHRGWVWFEAEQLLTSDIDMFGGVAPERRHLFAQLLLDLGIDLRTHALVHRGATLIQQRIDFGITPVVPTRRRAAGVERVEQILVG